MGLFNIDNRELIEGYLYRAVEQFVVPDGSRCVEYIRSNRVIRRKLAGLAGREYFYLFLQALHFQERCRIRQMQTLLFYKVCKLIGLDVIIKRADLSRNSSEQDTFNRLFDEFRRQSRQLRQGIDLLVNWRRGMARGFEPAHADIINGFIDLLNNCRHQWAQMKSNAILAQPPTPEQLVIYTSIETVEQQLRRIEDLGDRIGSLTDDLGSINQVMQNPNRFGPRRVAAVSDEIRPMVERITADGRLDDSERQEIIRERERIQREINEIRLQIPSRPDRSNMRRAKDRLIRILNRGGNRLRQRIREYLRLQNTEQFRDTQTRLRDQLLRSFDNLIQSPIHRFLALDENGKWQVYQNLLDGLISGIGTVSLEHLSATVFIGYGPVNSHRDMGLRESQGNMPPATLSIGTYPGHAGRHALSAVDINSSGPLPFVAVAPDRFMLPERFDGPEEFNYDGRSAIVQSRTRITNDLQDIFAKISYGLLRPAGQSRTSSSDVRILMSEDELRRRIHEEQAAAQRSDIIMTRDTFEGRYEHTLPPEVGRNPEAGRILAGLAYHNLTEVRVTGVSQRGLELLGRERQEILSALEAVVRRRMGLPEGEQIFLESGIRADERRTGLRHLIVLPDQDDYVLCLQYVRDEVRSRGEITIRLWRFLWELRGEGAQPSRAGQSVTVDHYYRSSNRSIVIRVFNAHVSAVNSISSRCQRLGQIGTTGGSVGIHNHVEISFFPVDTSSGQIRESDLIGFLLPHEFFPLLR